MIEDTLFIYKIAYDNNLPINPNAQIDEFEFEHLINILESWTGYEVEISNWTETGFLYHEVALLCFKHDSILQYNQLKEKTKHLLSSEDKNRIDVLETDSYKCLGYCYYSINTGCYGEYRVDYDSVIFIYEYPESFAIFLDYLVKYIDRLNLCIDIFKKYVNTF